MLTPLIPDRFKKFRITVPFDRSILKLYFHTFLRSLHSEHGSEYFRLFASTCVADCNTGVTTKDKNFPEVLHHIPYFFKGFLLANNHFSSLLFVLPCLHTASHTGEGPSLRIPSVNAVPISAHFGPIAAERLYISRRAGSIPIVNNNFFTYWTLFAAYVLPSR